MKSLLRLTLKPESFLKIFGDCIELLLRKIFEQYYFGTPPPPTSSKSDSIYDAMKGIMNLMSTPDVEAVNSYYSSVENNYINQNIDITNNFHGDRAVQAQSAEAMDDAVEDITGELARALAYVR